MKTRLIKHYIPLIIIVLIASYAFYLNRGNRNTITFVAFASGYISITILSFSLIIGPVNLLMNYKNPVSTYFRRDLSITGGALALIHTVSGLFVHLRGKTWLYFLKETESGYSIRHDNFGIANNTGLISALLILLLLITSNDLLLKKLKSARWKNIQRLSYLMFILTLVHCYFYRIGTKNFAPFWFFYIPLIAVIIVLQIIGVLKHNKQKSDI